MLSFFSTKARETSFIANALLAQPDRVFGYEPKGQGFESLAARQVQSLEIPKNLGVLRFSFFVLKMSFLTFF